MAQGVKCVKYIGIADLRIISDEDWDDIGIRMQGTVHWDAGNGFTVLGERLRDAAVSHLKEDPEFAVIVEDSG